MKRQFLTLSSKTHLLPLVLCVVAIVLASIPVHAREPTRPCDGFLKNGLHNVARAYRTEDIEKVAFKRHCRETASGYSFSDDAEFMWFFGATASPNFDARSGSKWCEENASRLNQASANFLEVLTFSQEALSAFNRCISLEKENVLTDALIENDTLIVFAWRNSGRESYLQRFDFDAIALDCSGTGSDEAGKPSKLVLDKPIKLVKDLKVNIICRRKAKAGSEPGVRSVLPRTTVALTTDLSTPFAITLTEQKDLEPSTVAELRAAIASIAEPQVILPWLPFDWEGNVRAIPQGWAICDGDARHGQHFADLRGRFLMGGTEAKTESAGSSGGNTGYSWRTARYEGKPRREYLHQDNEKVRPDLRPPWYSVVFLCRLSGSQAPSLALMPNQVP